MTFHVKAVACKSTSFPPATPSLQIRVLVSQSLIVFVHLRKLAYCILPLNPLPLTQKHSHSRTCTQLQTDTWTDIQIHTQLT